MLFAGSSSTGYSRGLRCHMASNERLIVVSPLQDVQKQENLPRDNTVNSVSG